MNTHASDHRPTGRPASRTGGVIHTYQAYDPRRFPSPTQPPPDLASGALNHLLTFGDTRRLTPEELARAVKLDPSQIPGLGPSIDSLIALLQERKRKILETYESHSVSHLAAENYEASAWSVKPPKRFQKRYEQARREEQIDALEQLWFHTDKEFTTFSRALISVIERLGEKYEIDAMIAKYTFLGNVPLSVARALAIKEELDTIEKLLEQLKQAREDAQIGIIDQEALAEFAETQDLEQLAALQQQIDDYLREIAERQGMEHRDGRYHLTPVAYRLFQSKLLERIFSQLQPSRTGRHQDHVLGEGAVELPQTRPWEFGDSITQMDATQTLVNAMIRNPSASPIRIRPEDIEIHRTRNTPKCATIVIMDMSGSMRYDGQYIHVKRMGLALDGLIRSEYPGDFLRFIEMATFARWKSIGQLPELMPKPVTISDPRVRLKADLSREDISESMIHPHFTNIQHALQLARRQLATQDTPNRQIILITDGLPTAHFEDAMLYLLYPPDPRTESATLREAHACRREGITINLFLIPSWSQSQEDIQFANRLCEATRGRVFFTAGGDLDRFVIWDYVLKKREIIG